MPNRYTKTLTFSMNSAMACSASLSLRGFLGMLWSFADFFLVCLTSGSSPSSSWASSSSSSASSSFLASSSSFPADSLPDSLAAESFPVSSSSSSSSCLSIWKTGFASATLLSSFFFLSFLGGSSSSAVLSSSFLLVLKTGGATSYCFFLAGMCI